MLGYQGYPVGAPFLVHQNLAIRNSSSMGGEGGDWGDFFWGGVNTVFISIVALTCALTLRL